MVIEVINRTLVSFFDNYSLHIVALKDHNNESNLNCILICLPIICSYFNVFTGVSKET